MSVKHKWSLPSKVTVLDPNKLNRNHLLVMLDFLGYPIARQPRDKQKKVEMLREQIVAQPEKAQLAYDTIVFGKVPEAQQQVVQDAEKMRAHFYGAMSDVLASDQAESIREKLTTMAEGLKGELAEYGKAAITKAAMNYRPVVIKMEGKKDKRVDGILPKEFDQIVKLCSQRVPVMMVGPAGCGKTYIGGKVAEAFDQEFYAQSCSEGVSESIFMGWLLPIDKGGTFQYVPSPFVTAYENGGVFLLDEIDAADPNLLTFLNMAIANDGFFLPQRHKKPYVKKHPDFIVIAAANTFGHGADAKYVGRNALDAATLDRYRAGMIHMDYSAEVEDALVEPGVLAWGRAIREVIYKHQMTRIMSTRVMLDLTKMTRNCQWVQADWERAYFADWSKDELAIWKSTQAAMPVKGV